MTTIIYDRLKNKVIQFRYQDEAKLTKALKKYSNYEIVENWADIRKINKDIYL